MGSLTIVKWQFLKFRDTVNTAVFKSMHCYVATPFDAKLGMQ